MRYFILRMQQLLKDESGATSIEYVLIASLIAVIILGAVSALGVQVCNRFNAVASALGANSIACA